MNKKNIDAGKADRSTNGDLIKIELVNTCDSDVSRKRTVYEEKNILLWELAEKYYESVKGLNPLFARVDDEGWDLLHALKRSCRVEFLDMRSRLARLSYQRTIYFLYLIVMNQLQPGQESALKYPLNGGIFIELKKEIPESVEFAWKLEKKMRELVEQDIPFSRRILRRSEILSDNPPEILTPEQIEFIRGCDVQEVFEYSCGDFSKVFYDPLLPSSGLLTMFEIVPYNGQIIIRVPQRDNPYSLSPYRDDYKLYNSFVEISRWRDFIDVRGVADLNRKIDNGEWHDLILINEAFQEKRLAVIADEIVKSGKRIILIAGPSSSGKTTFAQRLCIHLRVNGKRPLYMGTDDYFLERDQVPKDENGKFDFETLSAVDVDLFNTQMNALLNGETVDMPIFDFITGSKRYGTRITQAEGDQPIVIEGIHALNDELTSHIDDDKKYRIYISPLTSLNIDDSNRIPLTDIRFIRRMARDMRSRGKTARQTIEEWSSVRAGEIKNIFPFNNNADVLFNSSFVYELAVLKPFVEENLKEIERGDEAYLEAERLLRLLRCIKPLEDTSNISNNSIMREFIGGGIWVK